MEILSFNLDEITMAVEIKSRKGIVSKAPYELYMVFADMRNFVQFLPEDKKEGVEADYDCIHAQVQGFNIGVKVTERIPYSRIEFADDGAPFQFGMTLHFDPSADPVIDADAFNVERRVLARLGFPPVVIRVPRCSGAPASWPDVDFSEVLKSNH